jgi:glycosyltransferase involved in cell wall biosynthesis
MAMRAAIPYLFEAHEVFAETPQKDETEQKQLHDLEKRTLSAATWRVATSKALAAALVERYGKPGDYSIVPNAGDPPLPHSVAAPEGPLIYAGSIADWKGLDVVIEATRAAEMRLKIIGGSELEWNQLSAGRRTEHVIWRARMPLKELPNALEGARAGLIPTRTETPSGRYSCPMKLFDYARCGLPVLSTALPSLQTLEAGSWCRQVEPSTLEAWTEAMRYFRFNPVQGETARAWAGVHTWRRRAEALMRIFFARRRAD